MIVNHLELVPRMVTKSVSLNYVITEIKEFINASDKCLLLPLRGAIGLQLSHSLARLPQREHNPYSCHTSYHSPPPVGKIGWMFLVVPVVLKLKCTGTRNDHLSQASANFRLTTSSMGSLRYTRAFRVKASSLSEAILGRTLLSPGIYWSCKMGFKYPFQVLS